MPRFNARGDLLQNAVNGPLTVTRVGQASRRVLDPCGFARWLTDDEILCQSEFDGAYRVVRVDVRTGEVSAFESAPLAADAIAADSGLWALALNGHAYRDSLGQTADGPMPIDVNHGRILVKTSYQDGGLTVYAPQAKPRVLWTGFYDEARLWGERVLARVGGVLTAIEGDPVAPVRVQDFAFRGDWLCGYGDGVGLVLWRIGLDPMGWVLRDHPSDSDFFPDVFVQSDGLVRIASSATLGESGLQQYVFDPATGSINGVPRPRVDLRAPGASVPTPPPPPTPTPIPAPVPPAESDDDMPAFVPTEDRLKADIAIAAVKAQNDARNFGIDRTLEQWTDWVRQHGYDACARAGVVGNPILWAELAVSQMVSESLRGLGTNTGNEALLKASKEYLQRR